MDPHKLLVVGVSGGPDSLTLLDLLRKLGYRLLAAHYNHGLRPDASQDARLVEETAAAWQVPFVLGQGDAAAYAQAQGLSIEEAARTLRYQFLFEQAAAQHAQAVAVAHTANDQVETVLMHLLRGAGLSGLKGMQYHSLPNAWSQTLPLVRPLLGVWRAEVVEWCSAHGLSPAVDPTNLDTAFYRNRLRHDLLPYLESYNPNIYNSLWRMANVLGGDLEVIEQQVDHVWGRCLLQSGPTSVALDRLAVNGELPGMQRRIIRRAVENLQPGLRDIEFEWVERARAAFSGPVFSGPRDLGAGLFVVVEETAAWLGLWGHDLPQGDWPAVPAASGKCIELPLPAPGSALLEDGWELLAVPTAGPDVYTAALQNQNPYLAWVNADQLAAPLVVRCRRPGERFQPLGMGGHSLKLADYMINVKVPTRARPAWPLVCSGQEIVWLPGYRLAHPFRVLPDTNRAIHLKLQKIDNR